MSETQGQQTPTGRAQAQPRPDWLKQVVVAAGAVLALPGLFMALGFCCTSATLLGEGSWDASGAALSAFSAMLVLLGAGVVALWHGVRSQRQLPSRPLRLPPLWLLLGAFVLAVGVGLASAASGNVLLLLFPPALWLAAALPPLWSLSWFVRGSHPDAGLTWRRGLVALAGGATAGVLVALVLEFLVPTAILALVFDLSGTVFDAIEALSAALAGQDVAAAVAGPGFLYVVVQLAVVTPLVEEFAKPLIVLPVLKRLTRRDAFLAGALAGAGFAAVENVLYAGLGKPYWAGILVVRALVGALHPLGAGLVALGWHDLFSSRWTAWSSSLLRFGAAVGLHALWNGGTLLVLALAGAHFFGQPPPEIDILGLSAAGTTLALLVVLGLAALWAGRAIVQRLPAWSPAQAPAEAPYVLSSRAVAIWALLCLAAVVPAGILGLELLLR